MHPITYYSVFVGNIPFTVEEDQLVALVDEKAGTDYSSIRLVIDKKSGRSRGFAYVNYEEKTAAEASVEALSGLALDGRDVRVELSVPGVKRERPARGSRGGDERSIFIGNLDFNVEEDDLRNICEEALGEGMVKTVRLAKDRATGRPRGFGHVVFASEETVGLAIEALNNVDLMGRPIRVDRAQRKEVTHVHDPHQSNCTRS
jgi:RNA recognition motif-containing protein